MKIFVTRGKNRRGGPFENPVHGKYKSWEGQKVSGRKECPRTTLMNVKRISSFPNLQLFLGTRAQTKNNIVVMNTKTKT